jgi:transcriptional regulator with GAF, ATPase, and Fis domain
LDNLQFICPNCHRGKTIFFDEVRGKFKSTRSEHSKSSEPLKPCEKCGINTTKTLMCRSCANKNKKKREERFDKLVVESLLKEKGSMVSAAKVLGISDSGLKKFCIRNGISFKKVRPIPLP